VIKIKESFYEKVGAHQEGRGRKKADSGMFNRKRRSGF